MSLPSLQLLLFSKQFSAIATCFNLGSSENQNQEIQIDTLAYMVKETEKSQDLRLASWRLKRAVLCSSSMCPKA